MSHFILFKFFSSSISPFLKFSLPNFRITSSIFTKTLAKLLITITPHVSIRKNLHFYYVESSNLWTWYISPLFYVFFDFFLQYFTISSPQILYVFHNIYNSLDIHFACIYMYFLYFKFFGAIQFGYKDSTGFIKLVGKFFFYFLEVCKISVL